MRRIFDVLLLFVVALALGYGYLNRSQLVVQTHNLIYGAPCSKPETYSIGVLDPRFKLSTSSALALIERAANAWNQASGKDLLEYVPHGGAVTVNFDYDERQGVTQQLDTLNSSISQSSQSYAQLHSEYVSETASLTSQKQQLDSQKAVYEQKLAAYNQEVSSWNARGGAPEPVRQQLANEQQTLQDEAAHIQQLISSYNAQVQQVNVIIHQMNAAADTNNATISTYNSLANATGPEFTEGEYTSDGTTRAIDIYQFSNTDRLLRVIEHEFGHSLGLGHVSDPQSIMYYKNSGSSLLPNAADLSELARACSSSATASSGI